MTAHLLDPCHERFAWRALARPFANVVAPAIALVLVVAWLQGTPLPEALRAPPAGTWLAAAVGVATLVFLGRHLVHRYASGQWGSGWRAGLWAHVLALALCLPVAQSYSVVMDTTAWLVASLTGS